ncbi:MICOS complex subunit MIC60 [Frankliniella fusca]|uniref:MICOS complex subunit MIC60 n=1 Tax=Frankliniella fusca TaxID=407009 RepID=A0AAE1LI71_9NEOP|nr:MICOS complex subunit MIC60 [Frankliniella fusca]
MYVYSYWRSESRHPSCCRLFTVMTKGFVCSGGEMLALESAGYHTPVILQSRAE